MTYIARKEWGGELSFRLQECLLELYSSIGRYRWLSVPMACMHCWQEGEGKRREERRKGRKGEGEGTVGICG